MSKINDGGLAFPWEDMSDSSGVPMPNPGMSLRDYFAAHAMSGFLANPEEERHHGMVAIAAYAVADAMIAERSKS